MGSGRDRGKPGRQRGGGGGCRARAASEAVGRGEQPGCGSPEAHGSSRSAGTRPPCPRGRRRGRVPSRSVPDTPNFWRLARPRPSAAGAPAAGAALRWRGPPPGGPGPGGRAALPRAPTRERRLLKGKHVGRGRGPHESPAASADARPDLEREHVDACPSPPHHAGLQAREGHARPGSRRLRTPPAQRGSPSGSPGPRGRPAAAHSLSLRSPLRSLPCTAAPEGQTKCDFGKRAPGQFWKSRPRARSS